MERVARLRTHVRELRVSELETLLGQLVRLREELAETLRVKENYLDEESARARSGPLDGRTFRTGRSWTQGLAQRELELASTIEDVGARIEEKRAEVLNARQEEEKLLRLEARHLARMAEDEQRRTDTALDEFALQADRREGEGVFRHGGSKVR